MAAKIIQHFIETKDFSDTILKDKLCAIVHKHATNACEMLNIDLVNVIIWPNADAVILETGDGGEILSKELVFIYIDPRRSVEELHKIIEKQIPNTIYHELNHIAREKYLGKDGMSFHENLSHAIISEGIASCFAYEKWPQAQMPWIAYSEKEIQDLVRIYKNREIFDDMSYDHGIWFYGTGDLPRWIGYKLGYYFVDRYLKQHSDFAWADIVKMESKDFLTHV